jgi:hypothetical protein
MQKNQGLIFPSELRPEKHTVRALDAASTCWRVQIPCMRTPAASSPPVAALMMLLLVWSGGAFAIGTGVISDEPDSSTTGEVGKPSDPVESLQPGWTPEVLQAGIDKCVNQILTLSFADYRRRNNLPPPSEAETASMLKKASEGNSPLIAPIRTTCDCVMHAVAKQHDPVYLANHAGEVQTELAEILRSGKCPRPQATG